MNDAAQGDRDRADVAASLRGDGEAFGRLVERYQATVAATMWRFTRDRNVWESLVQDVFVEAYRSLSGFKGAGSLEGWLRTIATRVGYRHWKRQVRERREAVVHLEDWSPVTRPEEEPNDPAEAAEVVHRLLAALPPRDRLVLTLLYLEECSVEEAARRIGWSRSMVKVQAHRARKKMNRLLEEQRDSHEQL